MKHISLTLLLLLSAIATQAAAIKIVDKNALHHTANELLDYQQTHINNPDVYFSLGEIYQTLIDGEHPIRDYSELDTELYNIALFYGSCLHYAQEGASLRSEVYRPVPKKGKHPTVQELSDYLTPRIERARKGRTQARRLYQCYLDLRENIDQCRMLFTRFSERFPREKEAHLLMDATGALADLQTLRQLADSLDGHIAAYLEALKDYPISGYNPVFSWNEIRLYRVDGLTDVNLLEDEVALWDYSAWVKHFIGEQQTIYQAYYDQLNQAHDSEGSAYILNLINRLDYHSFMHSYMSILSDRRQGEKALQDSIWEHTDREDYLERALDIAYRQYKAIDHAQGAYEELKTRISKDEMHKYKQNLQRWNLQTTKDILRSGMQDVDTCRSQFLTMSERIATTITPQPFRRYTNELTDETITAAMLDRMGLTADGAIVTILAVGSRYMAVYDNGATRFFSTRHEASGEDPEATEEDNTLHQYPEHTETLEAYQLNGNTIALIGTNHIQFIDEHGKIKIF